MGLRSALSFEAFIDKSARYIELVRLQLPKPLFTKKVSIFICGAKGSKYIQQKPCMPGRVIKNDAI